MIIPFYFWCHMSHVIIQVIWCFIACLLHVWYHFTSHVLFQQSLMCHFLIHLFLQPSEPLHNQNHCHHSYTCTKESWSIISGLHHLQNSSRLPLHLKTKNTFVPHNQPKTIVPINVSISTSQSEMLLLFHTSLYGGFHRWGTPIYGCFLSWKITHKSGWSHMVNASGIECKYGKFHLQVVDDEWGQIECLWV